MNEEICPFCDPVPQERLFHDGQLVRGLWDRFPVSKGHALVVARRHIASWFDSTPEERDAITRATWIARREIEKLYKPNGFNIGINIGKAAGQTISHLHVHIIPRYDGDVPNPHGGVRHVIPLKGNYLANSNVGPIAKQTALGQTSWDTLNQPTLISGGEDPLLPSLLAHLDRSFQVDIAVAFIVGSGVIQVEQHLRDLLSRNGRVRILTGDYMDLTDPDALMLLLDLEGDVTLRVFETRLTSFHPKAYLFYHQDGSRVAYVGSSNLSKTALTDGIEWNYRVVSSEESEVFGKVAQAFEGLFNHSASRPIDNDWIAEYRKRRRRRILHQVVTEIEDEPLPPPPVPHAIQLEALHALDGTRQKGNSAGLVVLATGLGKTWLSAFDSNRAEFKRVLFVAHREEILIQAMQTFRRVRPQAVLGHYTGTQKNTDAEVVFASIQTLGRSRHLTRFEPNAFDYIVVDEFHHASATTYRRLISYFKPRFLLGLTATPERTDGGDLLGLCQENLVYRRDLFDGIRLELLSPFHYFGVPDEVDYRNIPWRSSRFDEEALTQALATQSRAQNALEQFRLRAGKRTLAFCSSQRHADFMANFFREAGLRAVAVHSGESSAPRATSLECLEVGDLEIIFAVDIFNEGLDIPHVDTVMMLRPTESRILWLQQLGRGLRRAEGKERLTVIDYIGNHRTFLIKPRTLFQLGAGDSEIARALQLLQMGSADLPPGCEVTYDLKAVEIIQGMLRTSRRDEALKMYYEDFRERHGVRPTALEAFHDGYIPRSARTAYGSWLGLVAFMGDLTVPQNEVRNRISEFLDVLEITPMTKGFKMVLVLAMLNHDRLPGEVSIQELIDGFIEISGRSAKLRDDIGSAFDNIYHLRRLLEENPIRAWTEGRGTGGTQFFAYSGDAFRFNIAVPENERVAMQELVRELVEWRLAEYLQRGADTIDGEERIICRVSHTAGKPIIFLDREKFPQLPEGWTNVIINGKTYRANFVKIAVNVIRGADSEANELPALLRGWFGPDAGLPGTNFRVSLNQEEEAYILKPLKSEENRNPLELWRSYSREQIPALFGEKFSTARWNTGFVTSPGHLFLLVTLNKGQMGESFQYRDRFLDQRTFEWQSQNRTSRASTTGEMIEQHRARGIEVHLFVRKDKRALGGTSAPFIYCGKLDFIEWERDQPITVTWRLLDPIPDRLFSSFKN